MSRLTFHEPAQDVCWQKQRRDQHAHEGTPPVSSLELKGAVVRPVSRRLARQIIMKYEWLGTMAPTSAHYGLFFDAFCAGVVCFALGNGTGGPYVHRPFDVGRNEVATLARGACVHWAPRSSNSRLVSVACRLLSAQSDARVVLAYADTDAGEIGTIYQACNWRYIGRGAATTQYISPLGRIYDDRTIGQWAKKNKLNLRDQRDAMVEVGWATQMGNAKHRYCNVLDKRDRDLMGRVASMSQPYPKRAAEATR